MTTDPSVPRPAPHPLRRSRASRASRGPGFPDRSRPASGLAGAAVRGVDGVRRAPSVPSARGVPGAGGPAGPGRTVVLRSPEEVLAAVPFLLGFEPEDSLVMITCGGAGRAFHARIDLPPTGRADLVADGCVGPLLDAVTTHGVTQVAFVLYTPDRDLSRHVVVEIERAFADIAVLPVLRVNDHAWHLVDARGETPARPCGDTASVLALSDLPDRSRHPPFRSRAELASSIGPDAEQHDLVAPHLARRDPDGHAGGPSDRGPRPWPVVGPAELAWVLEVTGGRPGSDGLCQDDPARDDLAPDDLAPDDLARLLVALRDRGVREAVWDAMTCRRARVVCGWWTHVVRRTPDPWLPEAACTLALVAWLAGDGALSWCAVERCRSVDPSHTGAAVVASFLEGAVDPAAWDELAAVERVDSRGGWMP